MKHEEVNWKLLKIGIVGIIILSITLLIGICLLGKLTLQGGKMRWNTGKIEIEGTGWIVLLGLFMVGNVIGSIIWEFI